MGTTAKIYTVYKYPQAHIVYMIYAYVMSAFLSECIKWEKFCNDGS